METPSLWSGPWFPSWALLSENLLEGQGRCSERQAHWLSKPPEILEEMVHFLAGSQDDGALSIKSKDKRMKERMR